jgi:photosystem II stability/assembly factor-like uncharacterized protein
VLGIILPMMSLRASWSLLPAGTAIAAAFAADSSGQGLWLGLPHSGLWRSSNGGQVWLPANSSLSPSDGQAGVYSMESVDAEFDTVILRAATSDYHSQIWYSSNGGTSWNHFPDYLLQGWPGDLMSLWRNNHAVFLHCDARSFHHSTDFGQTWETYPLPDSLAGATLFVLVQDRFRDSTLFIASDYYFDESWGRSYSGLVRSDDLGQTWAQVINFHALYGLTLAFVEDVARLSNDQLLIAITQTDPAWENGMLLVSTDDGQSWTRIFGGLPDRFSPRMVLEDPQQPGTLFVIGRQKHGLYWSHDYGQTWTRCYNGLPANVGRVNDLYLNSFSGAIYAAYSGYGVYVTHDHGESWQSIPMPNVGPWGDFGVTAGTVFERDDGYRAWRLNPGANEWTEMDVPLAQDTLVMMRPVSYYSGDTLVTGLWKRNVFGPATDSFQMTYSYDDGQTWQHDPFLSFVPDYMNIFRNANVIRFLALEPTLLHWSENLGHTWNTTGLAPGLWPTGGLTQDESAIYITAVDSLTLQSEVARTVDHGANWQVLDFPGAQFQYNPLPTIVGDGLVVLAENVMWRWRAGGWDQRGIIPQHQNLFRLIAIPREDRTLMFGVSFGTNDAWLSADTGGTWQMPSIEPPTQSFGFTDLRWDEARQQIWAVAALGTCYLPVEQLIAAGPLHFLPADFTVLSAFPNPFNTETRIRFDLDRNTKVKLDVYDLNGRLVQNLSNVLQNAGRHEMTFDGSELASGTYFLRLETDRVHKVEKILLLK